MAGASIEVTFDDAEVLWAGLSPRGRGTLVVAPHVVLGDRSIPTRAGNTGKEWGRCHSVHGPSPRGRGTPVLPHRPALAHRSIPARAGNTSARGFPETCATVHPRAGGEHVGGAGDTKYSNGPSPRGRGTLLAHDSSAFSVRSIPARAGNTLRPVPWSAWFPVHPRAGGEHGQTSPTSSTADGPSPRGRGTRDLQLRGAVRRRSIPARAGNTKRA